MRTTKWLLPLVFALPLVAFGQASNDLPKLNHFDPSIVDKSLNPCDDFYKFVCSKWQAANPIPPDQSFWSTTSNLNLWNQTILRNTMEEASKAKDRDTVHQQVGDYWAACMDETAINSAGLKPLQPLLDEVANLKDKKQLATVIADLHKSTPAAWEGGNTQTNVAAFGYGSSQDLKDASLVVSGFDQGGLGMPGRDYYVGDNPKMVDVRQKYEQHLNNMFVLYGEKPDQAKEDAATVLRIETALAQAAMPAVVRRDPVKIYNVFSLQEFQKLTPSFDWTAYLKSVNSPTPKHYIVTSPDFFRAFEKVYATESLENWKTYLRWWTLHAHAPYLSKPFVDENFSFYGKVLSGAQQLQPRWRRCVNLADRDLGEALGQAYVEKAFPPSSKERTTKLVDNIEVALGQEIQTLDWMSPETKQEADTKLNAIEDKIGYPNHWRDYSSVKIVPNNLVANVAQATQFEFQRQLNKIGKPVDRSEWTMTPATINAYYDPQLNTINFPAGILQPPFFDPEKSDPVNHGAIGMVIGHEISHGFDDQGRKFDAKGDLRDWWTAEDAKKYEERAACIAREYTHDVPELGVKTNGELTLGEDSADNAGLRISLVALQNEYKKQNKSLDQKGEDGWTDSQRFFLAQAYQWCANVRPEVARTIITTNPHSLPQYRVNYVVKNFPEFWHAFSCKKGQPMVNEPACRVW
jgi:endothelin-converting enzyme/putative endopeptidase